ncbi:MAG: sulfite exporter TauE/SafE family protein [Chloroflexi bacterium]|nr:sulfite exporter TauE/SafE family protein [Chloroflexota bacterium]
MDWTVVGFIMVGFIAQVIDGSLGMAYGVSANSFLLNLGISPATASASVHLSEVITTAISGYSHWKLGNVVRQRLIRLAVPGVLGGVLGAYILTHLNGEVIKPYISAYLLVMGGQIVFRAIRNSPHHEKESRLEFLGFIGGLMDAIGGGGWGPIVTTTMIARGNEPRKVIGTVNLSEFFVTFAQAVTFVALLKELRWDLVLGLAAGGVLAAPLGARLVQVVKPRVMMVMVGLLIIGLSLNTIFQSIF